MISLLLARQHKSPCGFCFQISLSFTVKASYNAKGSHEKQWALRECIAAEQQPGKKETQELCLLEDSP